MQATEYLQGLITNWLNGDDFPSVPGQLKIALSEADPTDTGSGFDETTGGSYARQNITLTAPTTNEVNGAVSSNNAAIIFSGLPTVTATHIAIFNNAGSQMLFYGPLEAVRAVVSGDSISFPANSISVAFKGVISKYLGEAVMNWARGTSMPTAPTSVKMELSKANPLRDGTGIQLPSGSDGYLSQDLVFNVPVFASGTGTTITNAEPIIFGPASTTAWGSITYAAAYAGSNMLFYGPLAATKTVAVGESIGFAAESLSLLVR
ncbi:MAG: hypothetical protein ACKO0Z_25240 [Betaproteobacteria bacterium]